MKRRILSFISSLVAFSAMFTVSVVHAESPNEDYKKIDGSYLTTDETSTGTSSSKTKGKYLMTGDCTISKAGTGRVYAYGSTTANQEVNYIATIVYIDRYLEDVDKWGYVDAWMVKKEHDFYLSTAKTINVDGGYYYRARADHFAGDSYPYDETSSVTNGIFIK